MNFPATVKWQCGNRRIEIQAGRPFLLGILNVTPDSFSDGGKYEKRDTAVRRGLELCEVADGVDVGVNQQGQAPRQFQPRRRGKG